MDPFLVFFFSTASLVLGVLGYKLNKEKHDRERALEKFKDYARGRINIEHIYVDAIMIGPRKSGKTSIAQLWTSPWTQIGKIKPSEVWRVYEKDLYEFDEEDKENPDISMEQTYQSVLRLRLHDYPGEDNYRTRAINKLTEISEKAVLIFVFRVEFANDKIQSFTENASYFSAQFTEMIFNQVDSLSGSVAKAIIVFNKTDLLPNDWSDSKILQELKKANRDAIHQIERLFSGNLEYHLLSALTNKGIVQLMGSIGMAGIESKRETKSFKQHVERLQETFGIERG